MTGQPVDRSTESLSVSELTNLVALVPMRHDSERVPEKNFRSFHGRPLFHHILMALSDVSRIATIVVDTDSDVIRRSCASDFPQVVCTERPQWLRDGRTPMTRVLQHGAERFPSPWYLQTHSTNPLLSPASIEAGIERLEASLERHDSLVSVNHHQARFFRSDGEPINHDPFVLERTQDLPPILEENSCLYVFRRDQIRSGRRFGRTPLFYPLPRLEALDIDTEEDFSLAELAYRFRRERGGA